MNAAPALPTLTTIKTEDVLDLLAAARERDADTDPWIHYERSALFALDRYGVETLSGATLYQGRDRWAVWAAETIVWTIAQLRAGDFKSGLRGWGQLREYTGRHGGHLPVGLSDAAIAIQNAIEAAVVPRAEVRP